jgi:RNA polymerase sigma-70 factor (ECF subfamily)
VEHLSDQEILENIHKSDSRHYGFNMLVRKYQQRTYYHIRRLVIDHDDADDILQNTFVKIWENIDRFREQSKLYTWIYRIATNESLTFIKKKKLKYFVSLNDLSDKLANSLQDDPYYDGDTIQTELQKAVIKLPHKQQLVFNMRYYEKMKYEEMSEILDTSVGALKASYHHAVKKIENELGKLNLPLVNQSY